MSHSEEFEFLSVKGEPNEEQQLPHLEFEFVSVKEEPKEEQQLPHQEFEFVSVKEEISDQQQFLFENKLYDNYKECDVSRMTIEKSLKWSAKDQTKLCESGGVGEMQNIADATYAVLICRRVRIGNYCIVPKDRVLISSVGVQIQVPSVADDMKAVTVNIERSGIRKVLIRYGRGLQVIFLYTMCTVAKHVRQTLGMESIFGPYFDPKSQDDTQKQITLLPETISWQSEAALKSIFGSILVEISSSEANKLLVISSPKLKKFNFKCRKVDVSSTTIEKSLGSSVEEQTKLVEASGGVGEMQNIVDSTTTLLICRSVRIGNYHVVPKGVVLISSVGVKIQVPSVTDDMKAVTVDIERSGIRNVLIRYGRGLQVIFLYTMCTVAKHVRQTLGMESSFGPYFDPNSQDDSQKQITLLPETISWQSEAALKSIFGSILVKINSSEANELLVISSPKLISVQDGTVISVAKRMRPAI